MTFFIPKTVRKLPHSKSSKRPKYGGFTLLELIISLALLGMLLLVLYSGLNIGIRSWDTGDAKVAQAAHERSVQAFLRRELGQVFPVRWRGISESKIAFDGGKSELRFVTSLNLAADAASLGGLQWGHIYVADDEVNGKRMNSLFIRRDSFDIFAKDFDGIAATKPHRLLEDVKEIDIAYFGADTDTADAKWVDKWENPLRMPQLVRMRIELQNGKSLPEIVVALRIGEEAGCYETNFQRQCGPRRA